MNEIGTPVNYEITYDDDTHRNYRYDVKTNEYGYVNIDLTVSKYYQSDLYYLKSRLNRVGIEEMEENEYVIVVSFSIRKTEKGNITSFGTINAQAAQIMATNAKAISDYINEMADKGMRLIMVFSSPVTDDNDVVRERGLDRIKSLVNRPVTEREVRNYVKLEKLLNGYFDKVYRSIMVYGDFRPQMTSDESERYDDNLITFINHLNITGSKKGMLLCLYDKQFNLNDLLSIAKKEVVSEIKDGDDENIIQIKTYLTLLRKLRKIIDATDAKTVKELIANYQVSPTALPADENTMRERLYSKYFDEQIKINPLLKNFVKFKSGSQFGIYDYTKRVDSVKEPEPEKTNAEIDDMITNALNAQKLIIKIGPQSSLTIDALNEALNKIISRYPNLSNLLTTNENGIEVKDIEEHFAKSIVRQIRVALNTEFSNGHDNVVITYGGQPLEA